MSQLQVTGEAKIRDIQGPVVANSGVITALDGAANQYVRGDGTLASFPTSGGGGSSVSYYLNGSVNQGTFGGSTYYEMSEDAIIGTGTNFSTSTNGLIAQFITDVNVPDVTEIPSGNWNVEFFMGVSASSGALASFYVEIYKWDGTTFTLIATNVATPEQLTNTTTVDAYFTSVAMPTTALSVTDRLAVRIFVNVAGKTVTLYTEDNRLCQIVTTFSKGVTSINNLTDQSQYLTTGTSGTDFNIVSSGDTHTFNIPSASATNRGLITTGTQTIGGAKSFESAIKLKDGSATGGVGYVGLGSNAEGLTLGIYDSGSVYFQDLYFPTTNGYQYTFPAASGTLALTDDLSDYVPYTGATGDVDLGVYSLSAGELNIKKFGTITSAINFEQATGTSIAGAGYTSIGPIGTDGVTFFFGGSTNSLTFKNNLLTSSRTYSLPDATGTIALTSNLSAYVPYTGATTNVDLGIYNIFSSFVYAEGAGGSTNGGILIKQYSGALAANSGYTSLFATPNQLGINFSGVYNTFLQSGTLTASRTYTLPDITGTLALLEGTQTFSGSKTFTQSPISEGGYSFKILASGTLFGNGYSVISSLAGNVSISQAISAGNLKSFTFDFSSWATNTFYTYALPASDGTLALTSNIPSVSGTSTYIPVFTGTNSLGNSQIWNNGGIIGMGTNYSNPAFYVVASSGDTLTQGKLAINTTSFSGTSVLQVNGAATLTGNLTGTSAAFSSFVNAFSFTAIGGTSNAGQISLKHTGAISVGDGYVTIAADSSNTLGIYFFNSFSAKFSISALTNNRTYTLPDGTGTLALTSNLSAYLPLAGGTLTGALIGTTSSFSGTVSSIVTSGGTSFRVVNADNSRAWSLVPYTNGAESDLWLYYGGTGGGTKVSFVNNGNVLIGSTTDAGFKLDVSGTGRFTGALSGTSATFSGDLLVGLTSSSFQVANRNVVVVNGTSSALYGLVIGGVNKGYIYSDATSVRLMSLDASGFMSFGTNNTERMHINSSGNVGIGTSSPQGGGGATDRTLSINSGSGAASFLTGLVGEVKYSTLFTSSSQVTLETNAAIPLIFNTNSTERMRITSGGNVGIGTSSPQERFEIAGLNGNIRLYGRSGISDNQLSSNVYYNGSAWVRDNGSFGAVAINLNPSGVITFNTTSATSGFPDERMRITSGGFVAIGNAADGTGYALELARSASTPRIDFVDNSVYTAQLKSNGGIATLQNSSNNALIFGTNATERMRITSGGNVGIGTTTPATFRLSVAGDGNVVAISSSNNSLSLALGYQGTMHGYLGGISSRIEAYSNNGGYVFLNSSSVWVPASDVKRKRNFETYNLGLDAILGLKPKRYNMDFQKDGDEKQVGLVAQEVKECIPQAFEQSEDFIGINYNVIIVTLVNAIQELKAEIDELKNK